MPPAIDDYLDQNAARFDDELFALLRIKSVSADPAFRDEIRRAAGWLADRFRGMRLATEAAETPGNPIVLAESLPVPGAPRVLVYGHYDVQPPDPLDLWTSPPFEPTVRDGNLYARGATDDKGQLYTHVAGAEAWLATAGKLPVQLKFLIEGEEEVGSEHLEAFIDANRERLACDVVVISDTSQFADGIPAITYGLRGLAYFELRLSGPKQDLHSGTFGGAVANPAIALSRMLAALIDEHGRVQIPGFYDEVATLGADEERAMASLPFDEAAFKRQVGVEQLAGEEGFTTLQRRWTRPTFDINGLTSGYQGAGAKTVLPAQASAKFSFRLVPNQDPAKITKAVRRRLEELCPPGVRMELVEYGAGPGFTVSLDNPFVAAASRAIEHGFGRAPVFVREGGSIPVVSTFRHLLGVDTLLLGWGRDDDNMHSPNEKLSLADFHRGIRASARLWGELAAVRR